MAEGRKSICLRSSPGAWVRVVPCPCRFNDALGLTHCRPAGNAGCDASVPDKGGREMKRLVTYYIGWDVGAWHCDKRRQSCDAIAIVDRAAEPVGEPWRENLSGLIGAASHWREWAQLVFEGCKAGAPEPEARFVLAIDAPLAFPKDFVKLVSGRGTCAGIRTYAENPLLFRRTEQRLFGRKRPLSAVQDALGSQATKAMCFVAKFAPEKKSCGVFSDGEEFMVIETYPGACERQLDSALPAAFRYREKSDERDALVCALIARLFDSRELHLECPQADDPFDEGWIWVPPRDGGFSVEHLRALQRAAKRRLRGSLHRQRRR